MIEFLLSGGPEGTNDLLYLIISNDGHYYYYLAPHVYWYHLWGFYLLSCWVSRLSPGQQRQVHSINQGEVSMNSVFYTGRGFQWDSHIELHSIDDKKTNPRTYAYAYDTTVKLKMW